MTTPSEQAIAAEREGEVESWAYLPAMRPGSGSGESGKESRQAPHLPPQRAEVPATA